MSDQLKAEKDAVDVAAAALETADLPVVEAQSDLSGLLPTAEEYDLAALRILKDGKAVDDIAAQDAMFGARAAGLRASLKAKEDGSPPLRLALTRAQRAFEAVKPALDDALSIAHKNLSDAQAALEAAISAQEVLG